MNDKKRGGKREHGRRDRRVNMFNPYLSLGLLEMREVTAMKRRISNPHIIFGIVSLLVIVLILFAYEAYWSIDSDPEDVDDIITVALGMIVLWIPFTIQALVKKRKYDFFFDMCFIIVYAIMFVTAADLI